MKGLMKWRYLQVELECFRRVLESVAQPQSGRRYVQSKGKDAALGKIIATGGGCIETPEILETLKNQKFVIWVQETQFKEGLEEMDKKASAAVRANICINELVVTLSCDTPLLRL